MLTTVSRLGVISTKLPIIITSTRSFTVISVASRPRHHYIVRDPSERKINREKRKEARNQMSENNSILNEEAEKSNFEKKWDCRLSLIVERQPIVFGQPPEWYSKFEAVRKQRRLDKVMPAIDKNVADFLNDTEEELVQEDKDTIEMQKLHESTTSDITPADKANDRTSLLRNTPGFLYLLVENAFGWGFPSIEFEEEKYKSTRQALERLAAATYGKDLQLYYWGYPPCVHTIQKYSPEMQRKKNVFGEKVFFYRAARLIGDVNLVPSAAKKFNWVSLKEMPDYIKDEQLIGLFNRVLE